MAGEEVYISRKNRYAVLARLRPSRSGISGNMMSIGPSPKARHVNRSDGLGMFQDIVNYNSGLEAAATGAWVRSVSMY